jgi:NADPH2:quinone reductase
MKAAIRGEQGLEFADIEPPKPGPEEVLVRVRACALNRADLAVLAGQMHGSVGGPGTVIGMEFAGEVVATGTAVTGPTVGERVTCSGRAAFAEYALADVGRAMRLPDAAMSFEQATTLPVALQTMHDAVVTNGGLQIAKLMGAGLVIGSSTNPQRRARLAEFGADLALDSADDGWVDEAMNATGGRGVDLIVDQLCGPVANRNLAAAAVRGRIVNVGRLAGARAEFDFDLHALKRIDYVGVTFRTRSVHEVREITARMTADLWPHLCAGRLRLPIDRVFPFERIGEAFERMRANAHLGKIVVTMT